MALIDLPEDERARFAEERKAGEMALRKLQEEVRQEKEKVTAVTEIPVTRSRNAQKMIYHKPAGRTRKKRPALQKIGVIGSSFVP